MPDIQCLSITIRPLYDVFRDEKFQQIIIDYLTIELVKEKKVSAYLISWEHGDMNDDPNHFQMAFLTSENLRCDNLKTALTTRLVKAGYVDLVGNKVWYKAKVHDNSVGLFGYCWKEKPIKYITNLDIEYLDDCREKYLQFQSGAVVASNVHIDNLIQNIEKYCDSMELSKSQTNPWDIVKVFIKQGKLSFSVFKKIKKDDLYEFWTIKHHYM